MITKIKTKFNRLVVYLDLVFALFLFVLGLASIIVFKNVKVLITFIVLASIVLFYTFKVHKTKN